MNNRLPIPGLKSNQGFTLVEILFTMLIMSVGLMGLAVLMARIHVAELESYQRTQALILMSDITERLNVNRSTVKCFVVTTNMTNGTPYLGTQGNDLYIPTTCLYGTTAQSAQAITILNELNAQLQGGHETKTGGTRTGAMIGARACISYDATTELVVNGATIAGTGPYTITVVWQGLSDTVASSTPCANGLYGAETKRRVVTTKIRFANLMVQLDSKGGTLL